MERHAANVVLNSLESGVVVYILRLSLCVAGQQRATAEAGVCGTRACVCGVLMARARECCQGTLEPS
jgi:hypothetical protein